jgi:hypothetical protein
MRNAFVQSGGSAIPTLFLVIGLGRCRDTPMTYESLASYLIRASIGLQKTEPLGGEMAE